MRKHREPIRTISYIPLTPDKSVMACLDDLTPEQRNDIGTALTVKMLNAQFAGRVEFWAEQ